MHVIIQLQKPEHDDEILGCLRSAAGKARLLSAQKFKQFEGMYYIHHQYEYEYINSW